MIDIKLLLSVCVLANKFATGNLRNGSAFVEWNVHVWGKHGLMFFYRFQFINRRLEGKNMYKIANEILNRNFITKFLLYIDVSNKQFFSTFCTWIWKCCSLWAGDYIYTQERPSIQVNQHWTKSFILLQEQLFIEHGLEIVFKILFATVLSYRKNIGIFYIEGNMVNYKKLRNFFLY